MTEMTSYPPGAFCWAALATTDTEGARRFDTSLFGLTASDAPAGGAGTYTMLTKDGKKVCALYGMSEEMRGVSVTSTSGSIL